MKKVLILTVLFAAASLFAAAQSTTQPTSSTPKIRHVAAPRVSASDGAANYKAYCAACHGAAAKGDGPAAAALKLPPTDLTRLAANTGGQYPALHVKTVILNADVAAHGSKDMPVWGPVFRSLSSGEQGDVELRASNLTKYIESLQAK
ncbi:MAG TPA: cytochrome c [Candidatus Koribacter sp.]|jgi:mono/diheme cytochrome c family protein